MGARLQWILDAGWSVHLTKGEGCYVAEAVQDGSRGIPDESGAIHWENSVEAEGATPWEALNDVADCVVEKRLAECFPLAGDELDD